MIGLQLTVQVRTIAIATVSLHALYLFWNVDLTLNLQTAVARGDWTQKVTGVSVSGEMLDLVNTINRMIDQLAIFAPHVRRCALLGTRRLECRIIILPKIVVHDRVRVVLKGIDDGVLVFGDDLLLGV